MGKNSGGNLVAFLGGILVGSLVGIMYAPEKGQNTRDLIRFRLDKYKERLQEIIDKLGQGREVSVSEAKSESQRVISDAIQHAKKLMSEVDALRSQITSTDKK